MSFPTLSILALATPTDGGQQPGWMAFVPFLLIILIFYFLLIAPARRKQKKHSEMLGALKNGDKVITQGGLHATVTGVSDDVVQVRIADNVKVDIAKNAVSGFQSPPTG